MSTTLNAVFIALQTAPALAMAIIAPLVLVHYTKSRTLDVRRFTYIYVFALYFLCAYFMTMLPLPTEKQLANLPPAREMLQLIPFKNFFDIRLETLPRDVAILVFNLVLTVPLGFFLRYLFGWSFKKVVLAGFLTAALYEFTQLSGLFFIYPGPYRFFDVDDFIINTLGAAVGYWCTPVLRRFLPAPTSDRSTLAQGSEVAFLQRCVATAIDLAVVSGVSILAIVAIGPLKRFFDSCGHLVSFPAFYALFLTVAGVYGLLFSGGTLGTRLTHLRLMVRGGGLASRPRCAARLITICTSVVAIPFWVLFLMTVNRDYAGAKSILWVFLGTLLMIFAAAVILEMLFNGVTHGASMFYDRFFKTWLAYDSSRKFSLFGIRVIDIQPLTAANVDLISEKLCQTLLDMQIPQASVTRVRLMTEGVLLDWIESGLAGTPCELRLDKRYKRRVLMLSVSGEDKTGRIGADTYAQMLKGLDLTLETYYAAEKNICNIFVP